MDIRASEYEHNAASTNLVESKIRKETEQMRNVLNQHAPDLAGDFDEMVDRYILAHHALGMAGEAGEVAGKVKKLIRDRPLRSEMGISETDALAHEAGDVMWYISAFIRFLGRSLGGVMRDNNDKLLDRLKRGVIGGNGDNR